MMSAARHRAQSAALETTVPIVQAGLLAPSFSFARSNGANIESMRKQAKLPDDVLCKPANFVPASSWFQLFRSVEKLSGACDVGWRIATEYPLKAYNRSFIDIIGNAPSLLEALRRLAISQSNHSNCQIFSIRVIGDWGYIFHRDTHRSPGYEQRNAMRCASFILFVRSYLGDDWKPDLLTTDTLLEVFPDCDMLDGVRIVRRRDFNMLRVPRADLGATSLKKIEGGYGSDEGLATGNRAQIQQLLRSYIGGDVPDLDRLAEMMRCSTRTMQRHLQQLQTSYSQLLHDATYDVATQLLRDNKRTITDVAHELGYKDASHFSRFFRGASGLTPREYRAGRV